MTEVTLINNSTFRRIRMLLAGGFALVEILIAVAILSTILLTVITGVSTSIHAIRGSKNRTHAMLIAKTQMNEFIVNNLRGTDISREPVKESPGFYFSRETLPFEHSLLGALPAKITHITVLWSERGKEKSYKISYIYQAQ